MSCCKEPTHFGQVPSTRSGCTKLSLGPHTMSMGSQRMYMAHQGMSMGPHEMSMGPHEMSMGPHKMSMAPHEMSLGPHIMSMGSQRMYMAHQGMSMAPHKMSMGPHKMSMAPHEMSLGPHTMSMGSQRMYMAHQGMSMGPHEMSMGPQNIIVGNCTINRNLLRIWDRPRSATPNNRRSAVELLEESKAQYVKTSSVRDTKQSLIHMATDNISVNRRLSHPVTNQPLRAKSEYDLSSQLKTSEEFSSPPSFRGCSNPSLMDVDCSTTESDSHLNMRPANGVVRLESSCLKTTQPSEEMTSVHCKSQPMSTSMIEQFQDLPIPISATVDDIVDMLPEKITQHFQNPPLQRNSEGVVLRRQKRPIHRSQSDVTYLHTRSSDISSIGSRLSRASIELEKFFNEMGIDRTILDPMLRQQEESVQKDADFFETLSSLDSPDTRSICSGISRSEKGQQSDAEMLDPQQNTSIVERNARIIKWLCNVKKARSQSVN